MVHTTVKGLFHVLGAVAMLLLLVTALAVVRLSIGPVSLSRLTPMIEDALSQADGSVVLRLNDTVLAWNSKEHLFSIIARGVRLVSADQTVATIPEMNLTLSVIGLLEGRVAPRSLRITDAHIGLVRREDGTIELGFGGQSAAPDSAAMTAMISGFLSPPEGSALAELREVLIRDASFSLEDRQHHLVWTAPDMDLSLFRDKPDLVLKGGLTLDLGTEHPRFDLEARYSRATNRVPFTLSFVNLRPSSLAPFGGVLADLGSFEFDTKGKLSSTVGLDSSLGDLSFHLQGAQGGLRLPPPATGAIPLTSFSLDGHTESQLSLVLVDEFRADLGGPQIHAHSRAERGGPLTHILTDVTLLNVPADSLKTLWPVGLAPNPRDWVTRNISKGIVTETRVQAVAHIKEGDASSFDIDSLTGNLALTGARIDYLAPMPPADEVAGTATFDLQKFVIKIQTGKASGLTLQDGTILFTNLDKGYGEQADIQLKIGGGVADTLRLLDSKPLGYASAVGLDPAKASGQEVTNLRIKFPLLAKLAVKDVQVNAHAVLSDASLPAVFMGLDAHSGALVLDVDQNGLDASGSLVLDQTPAQLKWRENFGPAPFRSRYQVSALVGEDERRTLGLDSPPFVAPWLSGPVQADVTATLQRGGKGEVEIKADLASARLTLPHLDWIKEEGKPGRASVLLRLADDKIVSVPMLEVHSGDLDVIGDASFTDGKLVRVNFSHANFGRTDGQGSIGFRGDKGLVLDFRGRSFDAMPLLGGKVKGGKEAAAATPATGDEPPMAISAAFDTLWVSEKGQLSGANIAMKREGQDWRAGRIEGRIGPKPLHILIDTDAANQRHLSIDSEDAGGVFKAFGIYEDMVGGVLSVKGSYDDSRPGKPLTGTAHVSEFTVVGAPVLARLLTVASFNGIIDLLNGDGIAFSSLDAPFSLSDGLLELHDARSFGNALGLTAKGQIDLDNDRIAMEGTIVPAYMLNSLLGNIPLLGGLITGDEGSGIFAATYSIKGTSNAPEVSVNPLATLAPGVLRKLFQIFDSNATNARPQSKSTP